MTILEDRPIAVAAPPVVEPPRTVVEQLDEWTQEARNDMTTSPTAADWLLDTYCWLCRCVILYAVTAVTWPWYLPSRGMRIALLLAVVAMAPAGYLAGTLTR